MFYIFHLKHGIIIPFRSTDREPQSGSGPTTSSVAESGSTDTDSQSSSEPTTGAGTEPGNTDTEPSKSTGSSE